MKIYIEDDLTSKTGRQCIVLDAKFNKILSA